MRPPESKIRMRFPSGVPSTNSSYRAKRVATGLPEKFERTSSARAARLDSVRSRPLDSVYDQPTHIAIPRMTNPQRKTAVNQAVSRNEIETLLKPVQLATSNPLHERYAKAVARLRFCSGAIG